jgi:hypothetical protein
MGSDEPQGWPEFGFADTVKSSVLTVRMQLTHQWLDPHKLLQENGALFHDGSEISMFHFRHTKKWPL